MVAEHFYRVFNIIDRQQEAKRTIRWIETIFVRFRRKLIVAQFKNKSL